MGVSSSNEYRKLRFSYSTSFLAKALPSHGQIDTLEFSPLHAQYANSTFLSLDLYPFPKVHVGSALDTLRDPSGAFRYPPGKTDGLPEAEQGYDLVFIDANKDQIHEYFQEAIRLTRKGGVIIVDNAVRNGRQVVSEEVKYDAEV
jgi:predicted O-methyltransferase YrrM